jgi:hypothetical protein
LQCGVERDRINTERMQYGKHRGEWQPAADWCRNVHAAKWRNQSSNAIASKEDDACKRERLDKIQPDLLRGFQSCLSCHTFPRLRCVNGVNTAMIAK